MPEQTEEQIPSFISRNIDVVIAAEQAASRRRTRSEAAYDLVSRFIGTWAFVGLQLTGVVIWVAMNEGLTPPIRPFDPFPFPILNQIVALEAVLMTAFVLMKQNRMSRFADRRAHLDLQINMLTERETTKIIQILMEICDRMGVQHKVFDDESHQLGRLLTIERLIEALHSKFPDR